MSFANRYFMFFISLFTSCSVYANLNSHDLKDLLNAWRVKNNVPAVVVLIKTPTNLNYFTSGSAKLKGTDPVPANALFGVGSITKTIIAAEILKLEAEGKLNIDNAIYTYYPEYPRWKNITIKELLNMTSGIFNYMNDVNYKKDLNNNYNTSWGRDKLIELSYHHRDDFKPEYGWNYTNTGYLLLGRIIEKVTHKPLGDVLQDAFFKPLGMHHTFYVENSYSPKIFKQLTMGYYNDVMIKPNLPHNLGAAAGGIVTNADDLLTFINHLLVMKDILPPKQLKELLSSVPIPAGKIKPTHSAYGLGLTITKTKKYGKIIWYTGVTPYHTSIYLWIPSQKILIIALASFNRHGDLNYDLLFPNKPLIETFMSSIKRLD